MADSTQPRYRKTQIEPVLEAMGYLVLRFWNNDVLQNLEGVLDEILSTLTQHRSGPLHPDPLPLGERPKKARANVQYRAHIRSYDVAHRATASQPRGGAHPRARRRHGHHDPAAQAG